MKRSKGYLFVTLDFENSEPIEFSTLRKLYMGQWMVLGFYFLDLSLKNDFRLFFVYKIVL